MTTRFKGCTVAFTQDIREDDAESMLNAIRMIKGVIAVEPVESSGEDFIIRARLVREVSEKLYGVIGEMIHGKREKT